MNNKSERLLNLLILLLVSRSFVTKDRIRDVDRRLPPRGPTRRSRRCSSATRTSSASLGIPIEVGHLDAYFDDEVGYRIKRDAFELPEIELEPDEAAVVGLAARVWQHAGLADATSQALLKLKAGGLEVDREALDVVQPQLVADEPAFDAVWAATQSRTPVAFDYRRSGLGEPTRRHAAAVGRRQRARSLVRRRVTTPTAGSPGCSGSRGSSATSRPTAGPAASSYPTAPTCAR